MQTLLLPAIVALAVLSPVLAPSSADARLLGKAKPKVDYSATPPVSPATVAGPPTGAIFQVATGYAPLYEGWRARAVGDLLTIVLVERTIASKSASSKLDSSGTSGITPPTTGNLALFAATDASVSGKRNFNGTGTTDQSNTLSGEVSVTVAEVYPNGTMLVKGQKSVTLNRGDEFVQIRGIIRMADVDPNNRVASTRVADAQIAYTGKGDVARASRQGWFSRFFSVISPF